MFSILKQLRASNDLDAKNPSSASKRREPRAGSEPQLRDEFVRVDELLRKTAPRQPPPQDLHKSVMKAVRAQNVGQTSGLPVRGASGPATAPRNFWVDPGLALGAACLTLALWFGLRGMAPKPVLPPKPSMTAASTALEFSGALTSTFPAAITAPMTDELERLNQDLAATTRTLLATLP